MKVIVHDAETNADVEMHAVDGNAAVAADPKRYSIVERKAPVRFLSVEDRLTAIEARLERLDPPKPRSAPAPKQPAPRSAPAKTELAKPGDK